MGLKECREKYTTYTQKDVCEALDIPLGTYRGWEQGTRGIKAPDLVKLATFFGCSTDEIIGTHQAKYAAVSYARNDLMELGAIYEALPEEAKRSLMACARGLMDEYVRKRNRVRDMSLNDYLDDHLQQQEPKW